MGPRFLQTCWAHTLGKHEAGGEEAQLVGAGVSPHRPGKLGHAPLLVRGTAVWEGVLGTSPELGPGCGLRVMRWGWPGMFPGKLAMGFAHICSCVTSWCGGVVWGALGVPSWKEPVGPGGGCGIISMRPRP